MKFHQIPNLLAAIAIAALVAACGNEPTNGGGGSAAGGVTASGGATVSGGAPAATGGRTSNGGSVASGGAPGSGGATVSGGTPSSGGATASGGAASSGGTQVMGGSSAKGGVNALGGTNSSGGTEVSGGATGTGGKSSTGGATSTGGKSGAGGINVTGGASAGGGAMVTGGVTGAGGSSHAGQWKIMALGDSITGYCYPQDLSLELTTNGHTNFTFIGTQTNNHGDCTKGAPATLKTEGHGGYGVTYLPQNSARKPFPCTKQSQGCGSYAELLTWAAEKPDIVLMHYGTNDVWDGQKASDITSAYTAVLVEFRKQNPNVIFFVAQIIPMNPSSSCCETGVESLNAAIPAWATSENTAASPIYVVNVWSAINPTTYLPNSTFTADGVHPNPTPSQAMADKWYAALIAQGLP